MGPTASRRYHRPQSGVFDDSFTVQNGCNSGNYHHVFLLAKVLMQEKMSGEFRVILIFKANVFFWIRRICKTVYP